MGSFDEGAVWPDFDIDSATAVLVAVQASGQVLQLLEEHHSFTLQ